MATLETLIREIEEERLPRTCKMLEAFEQGMRTGVRHGGDPYKDSTDADRQRVEDQIAEYEDILAALKRGDAP